VNQQLVLAQFHSRGHSAKAGNQSLALDASFRRHDSRCFVRDFQTEPAPNSLIISISGDKLFAINFDPVGWLKISGNSNKISVKQKCTTT